MIGDSTPQLTLYDSSLVEDARRWDKPRTAPSDRQRAAVTSALWAAWGDAVGWISELTDESGLLRRTQGKPLSGPVAWTRRVGGRNGVNVDLPAGTYSDDTQLRLAICRAYGPAGFDPEVFSAVELTIWPSYALGGGLGTKSAAVSMTRPGSRWSANRPPNYVEGGGNGAAMRVQPHAWHARRPTTAMLRDVMRDSVSTHGHPNALVGAALSAMAVFDCLPGGQERPAAARDGWHSLVDDVAVLKDVIDDDPELSAYWLPNWSHPRLGRWPEALSATLEEARRATDVADKALATATSLTEGYRDVINALSLRDPALRGSGLHTVLASFALVTLTRRYGASVADALLCAVNELGTDTDTIASMAGAVLGCDAPLPEGHILDQEYIAAEAARIAADGQPNPATTQYPDLLGWEPPKTQSDVLTERNGQLYVAGLGAARALEPPIGQARSEFAWQWVRVEATGQTLIIKRRLELSMTAPGSIPLPMTPRSGSLQTGNHEPGRRPSSPAAARVDAGSAPGNRHLMPDVSTSAAGPLNAAVEKVRESGYDVRIIGMQLARLAREDGATVGAAFGALMAAELAHLRRHGDDRR